MATDLAKNFVAGGVGGACTVIIGHPFDTIKVRLQTMPIPQPGTQALYNGAFDCLKKTVSKNGFFVNLIIFFNLKFNIFLCIISWNDCAFSWSLTVVCYIFWWM